MTILKSTVNYIAKLAKLELNPRELDLFARQLGDIVGYVEILNEINTEEVPPTSQVTGLTNILREDIVVHCPEHIRKSILSGIHSLKYGYVAIPKIIN